MKKSASRGRPRKNEITKLKVMAWFNAVSQASGKTAAELEREFAAPDHIRRSKDKNKEIRPGLWDKYRRGEVEPRSSPSKGKIISVVEAVETQYPGTARLLILPLWKLLDFNQPVSIEELNAIQKSISPETQHLLAETDVIETLLFQLDRMDDIQPQPLLFHVDITINKWTMVTILLRRTLLVQQESLINLIRTKLEATNSRSRKQQKNHYSE